MYSYMSLKIPSKPQHGITPVLPDASFRVSPRGDYVAFRQNYEVFAMPLLPGGQTVTVGGHSVVLLAARPTAED